DQVARREVVASVDHHVDSLEDAEDVLAGEALVERLHRDAGIERVEGLLRAVDLRRSDAIGGVNDLALQVGLVDDIAVDDAERAYAGRREIERRRRAQ